MIGGKKRHGALSAENHKRSKQAHEEENDRAETSSWDNDQHRQDVSTFEDLSSLASISDSIASASSSPCQDEPCVDGLAEVVIKLDINLNDARKRKENLPDVLKAEIALRNTSGGIIKINSPEKPTVKDRDDLMNKELYEKRKTLLGSECGESDSFDDIIDIETKESTTYIFVRKSSVPILTDDSHLRQRSEGRNYKVILYSRICEVLNRRKRRCICANEGKFKTSLHLGDTLSYETMTEEHKLLNPQKSEKLAKSICGKLSDNVVAFANTQGGTIYFGIEDNNASIRGQKIKDDEEKADIHRSIVECIERKLWALDSGEEYKPKKGTDYNIKFFPLDRGDDNRFIIAVHICAFPGAVFRQTPECSVLDQENKVFNMEFNEWLFLHNRTSVGNNSDRQKLNRKNRGRTVYYTVQETIEDIYNDLIEALPGKLKIRPSHAIDSIHNQSLKTFTDSLNKMFKEKEWKGITFIERCWGVNMGLPNTKPAKVICDILVCSPSIPLLLVSLTEEATSEAFEYNRKLAATLKRMLAQDGGCTEKFYVKPITLTCSEANDIGKTEMMTRTAFYPDSYQMCKEKYAAIIKALVPVLARVNSSAKDDVGKRMFDLLTKEQYNILFENFESQKLMITGPPGSGKTVLATERIYRLRQQGVSDREILFVCSNKVLEAQIRNMTLLVDGKQEPLCLVHNYFGIISRLRDKRVDKLAGVKHILIDECQNFKNKPRDLKFDWWKEFMNLYDDRHPPSLWIFSDMHQQVMRDACLLDRLGDGFSHKHLSTVIRNSAKIHQFNLRFMKKGPRIHLGHDFEGEDVEVVVPKTPSSFKVTRKQHLVYILISRLKAMVEKGVDPGTIGVLFTDEKHKEHYRKLFDECTRHCPIQDGQNFSKPGSIMFDTIRVFSGGDKENIIGFCPQYDSKTSFQNNEALMASLCSRAKLKLILILEDEGVASSFGLAKCMKKADVQWGQGAVIDFKM